MLTCSLLCAIAAVAQNDPAAKLNAAELRKFQGQWIQISSEFKGIDATPKHEVHPITVKGSEYTFQSESGATLKVKLQIDATKEPKHIDRIVASGRSSVGIYKFEGDTLRICDGTDGQRPAEFKTTPEGGRMVVWKRVSKNK
jgi:uncharacterized protein (TIGR03067 family)